MGIFGIKSADWSVISEPIGHCNKCANLVRPVARFCQTSEKIFFCKAKYHIEYTDNGSFKINERLYEYYLFHWPLKNFSVNLDYW